MPEALQRRPTIPQAPLEQPVVVEVSKPLQKRRPRSEGRAPPPCGPPPGSLTPGAPRGSGWCYHAQSARPRPVPSAMPQDSRSQAEEGSKVRDNASRSRSCTSLLSSSMHAHCGSAARLRGSSKRLTAAAATEGETLNPALGPFTDIRVGSSQGSRSPGRSVEWPIRDLCLEEGIDLSGREELHEHEVPVDDLGDFLSDMDDDQDGVLVGDTSHTPSKAPPAALLRPEVSTQPLVNVADELSNPHRRVGLGGVRPCYGGGGLAASNKPQRRTASNQPFAGGGVGGRGRPGSKGLRGVHSSPDLKLLAKTISWDTRAASKVGAMGLHGAAATSAWGAFHSWCNSQLPIEVWDDQIRQGASFKEFKWA